MHLLLQDMPQNYFCNKAVHAMKKSYFKSVQICKKASFAFPGKCDYAREKRVDFSITQIEN